MYVPDPIRGLHADKNLEMIRDQAGTKITETHVESIKSKAGAQSDAPQGNATKDLASAIAGDAVGLKTGMDLYEFMDERLRQGATRLPTSGEKNSLPGFIGNGAKTIDDSIRSFSTKQTFSITERSMLAGKSLRSKSEAMDDDYQPSTKGWRATDTKMEVTQQIVANARKQALANRLIQERDAEYAHQARAQGFGPSGMGGMQMGRQLAYNNYAPKGPSLEKTEEQATNWGAGTVTG